MKDIKIIIATHKQHFMPSDDMYLPLHVGKSGKEEVPPVTWTEGPFQLLRSLVSA